MPEYRPSFVEVAGPAPASSLPRKQSHRLRPSQYAVLVFIMLGASAGDALLSRGMRQIGPIPLDHPGLLFHALLNVWVLAGITVLIGFMGSYMAALSWADLTFVQPATAFGNVVTALIGRVWLHEVITPMRWAGIVCIVIGVGFVANGPSRTEHMAAAAEHTGEQP